MKTILLLLVMLFLVWLGGCAVMPSHIMDEALPPMPFEELTRNSDQYTGKMVVLGGYILAVENFKDHTRIMVLQTPLEMGQRPKSKDHSQGRMTIVHKGYLDAEVFTKDRMVTVGGRILEAATGEPPPYPHLRMAASEIHLWPVEPEFNDPHGYDHWHYYHWPRHYPWRHPHRHYR